MDAPPALDVRLQLRPVRTAHGTVHVEGTAALGDGPELRFSGWMALLQLLERMAAEPAD